MSSIVCLSDLHFGDEHAVLNDEYNASILAEDIGKQSGGQITRLILNGDIWEQCIPSLKEGPFIDGYCEATKKASQTFFKCLFSEVQIAEIVLLFGNHDLTLWDRLLSSLLPPEHSLKLEPRLYTNPKGITLRRNWSNPELSSSHQYELVTPEIARFLDSVFPPGSVDKITVAYPNYIAKETFPIILFHHGHLLDPYVLGWENTAESLLVKTLQLDYCFIDHDISSMKDLTKETEDFILKLWRENSEVDRVFWNDINRRLAHPKSCPFRHMEYSFDPSPDYYEENHATSRRDGMMPNVQWYLNLAITDPDLPTPVGSLDRSKPAPDAFSKPSCFVFGHDHLGSQSMVMAMGIPFEVRDSGGWTSEYAGHYPHSHFLIWDNDTVVVPRSVFVKLDL